MRSRSRRARWPGCARALLSVAVLLALAPVAHGDPTAPRRKRSVGDCSALRQIDRDDGVDLAIENQCKVPLDCRLSWVVTCAPKTRRRRTLPASLSVRVEMASSEVRTASAAPCGDDGWTIDRIVWRCEPARD